MISSCCPAAFGIRSGARMASGWCTRLLATVWVTCPAAKGEPPSLPRGEQGSQVTTAIRLSAFVRERDDKRLVPTGCRHTYLN